METKISTSRMGKVRLKCGHFCGVDVGAVGSRGGLSFGWKVGCSVTLRSLPLCIFVMCSAVQCGGFGLCAIGFYIKVKSLSGSSCLLATSPFAAEAMVCVEAAEMGL